MSPNISEPEKENGNHEMREKAPKEESVGCFDPVDMRVNLMVDAVRWFSSDEGSDSCFSFWGKRCLRSLHAFLHSEPQQAAIIAKMISSFIREAILRIRRAWKPTPAHAGGACRWAVHLCLLFESHVCRTGGHVPPLRFALPQVAFLRPDEPRRRLCFSITCPSVSDPARGRRPRRRPGRVTVNRRCRRLLRIRGRS